MAFVMLVIKEMFIKLTVFLILQHLMFLKIAHGYLGCADKSLVPCLNQTHCIKIEQVCVDFHDCIDEKGDKICHYCQGDRHESMACVTHVEPQLIFECLSPNQICNNKRDCINNEDEALCDINKCKRTFRFCENGTCVEKSKSCDSQNGCPDGSNQGDYCFENLCGINKIHCPTGECIPKSKICDGISHCSDGYDERNCTHLTSTISSKSKIKDSCSMSPDTFICSTSSTSIQPICISKDRICDGYKDCPMDDDERDCTKNCGSTSICPANHDVICIEHPIGDQICRCIKPGYRLSTNSSRNNTQICQDFDECNDSFGTYCSFKCINTDGSFNCTCPLGFTIDKITKTCRRRNDLSKPNLLILFDGNVNLYNIWNNTNYYSLNLLNTINIEKQHRFDFIQYDPNEMFVIYYDQNQHAILCKSNTTLKAIVLLSNIIVHGFAYNANEKTLFIIEKQSQTLRMYTPITCDMSYHIKMHSWPFDTISNSIQSMEIDFYNRQFIFASPYQFIVSNMSQPNLTKVVYTTDREIKRFIYDASFKRIFWTSSNINNNELYPVYTCDNEFKQCHDTSMLLTSAWPFAFFDDGFLYSPLSLKSLDIAYVYGTNRFSNDYIKFMRDSIRSFFLIDYQQNENSNLCMNSLKTRCENELCLQINSTTTNCLSIDENIRSKDSTRNPTNSVLENAIEQLFDHNNDSQANNQQKNFHYRPSNTVLFGIIILGIVAFILAVFVKRCHKRLHKKAAENEHNQSEQRLSIDEPNLSEFNITIEDRVSNQRVDYAREILFENSILIVGRRRESV